ncbi:MAG: hypothetical protein K0S33_611 [Bacteroidetes bacterium]|nr:hypothetical protein [Bacteroidota bacterium]
MNKLAKIVLNSAVGVSLLSAGVMNAGNPDRSGSSGGSQLLINPWARSSGWGGSNQANAHGLEAMFLNVAGMAFTKKTEVVFSRTNWLSGSNININAFGFSQHVGETGVLGLGIVALDGGDIDITTVDQPEGTDGQYSPLFLNIGLSYAKAFSDNIYGGATVKIISEQISNVAARGICLDAGIQYHTGKYDQFHLGISLKNVGPKMVYKGDGMSFEANIASGTQSNGTVSGYTATFEQRSANFELPSCLNMGASYDFLLGVNDSVKAKEVDHRISVAANYTSNSFTYDQYSLGVEYGFRKYFMVRAGYTYEKGQLKNDDRRTAFTGPSAGITLQLPFGSEKNKSFALDYSYRFTNPYAGVHSIGARINL